VPHRLLPFTNTQQYIMYTPFLEYPILLIDHKLIYRASFIHKPPTFADSSSPDLPFYKYTEVDYVYTLFRVPHLINRSQTHLWNLLFINKKPTSSDGAPSGEIPILLIDNTEPPTPYQKNPPLIYKQQRCLIPLFLTTFYP